MLAEKLQKNTGVTRGPENAKCGAGGVLRWQFGLI